MHKLSKLAPGESHHFICSISMSRRRAFTIVELAVVIGIIGVLCGLVLPAIQAARESARATQCRNNLKNIGLGLANFHAAHRCFPPGSDLLVLTEHAWSSHILPFLEHGILASQIDYRQPWDAAGANAAAASEDLPIYACPGAMALFSGKQDYGGIMGTSLLPLTAGPGPKDAFGCGILIHTSSQQPTGVRAATITDGLSFTLSVGESVDRDDTEAGRWACGRNSFAQIDRWINMDNLDSIHSYHPGGAHGLFADGHVRLLSEEIETPILGALCTRNGDEPSVGSRFTN